MAEGNVMTSCHEFEFERRLGSGANFGQLYLVRRYSDSAHFAVEEINLSVLIARFKRESSTIDNNALLSTAAATLVEIGRNEALLRQLNHQHLTHCFGSFQEGDNFHLVLEYSDCGNFRDAIREAIAEDERFSENQVKCWAKQLLSALAYLHAKQVTHRAIFPKNTFLAQNRDIAKLGTFGLSETLYTNFNQQSMSSVYLPSLQSSFSLKSTSSTSQHSLLYENDVNKGNIDSNVNWQYCPPEIIEGGSHSSQSDIWSLGVLLYETANLKLPFLAGTDQDLSNPMLRNDPDSFCSEYSSAFRSVILSFLEKDPAKRPTADEASATIQNAEQSPRVTRHLIRRSLSSGDINLPTIITLHDSFRLWRANNDISDPIHILIRSKLKSENLRLDDLMKMTDEEAKHLFPEITIFKRIKSWRKRDLRHSKSRLFSAIRCGNFVEIDRLLSLKPALFNNYPLHFASKVGQLDVVKFLYLRYFEEFNMPVNKNGDFPIHSGASAGHFNVVDFYLIKNPYLIDLKGSLGQTPLMKAAFHGRESVVELLLQNGASLMEKDNGPDNESVLHLAASSGNVTCCHLLLEKCPELIEAINNHGEVALWSAVKKGHYEVATFFLENWPKFLETRNRFWRTPLLEASVIGYLPLVTLFMEFGADILAKSFLPTDADGTAIHLASYYGHCDLVRYLLIFDEAKTGTKRLLEIGNKHGESPLWRAALSGKIEVVDFLLGLNANVEVRGQFGATPLLAASARGHVDVVDRLLRHSGGIINYRARDSEQGAMAIHLAAAHGHSDVVRLFLDRFPELIDEQDGCGLTAMTYSRFCNKPNVVSLLKERGAKRCQIVVRKLVSNN